VPERNSAKTGCSNFWRHEGHSQVSPVRDWLMAVSILTDRWIRWLIVNIDI
jgi:hypothetical protein